YKQPTEKYVSDDKDCGVSNSPVLKLEYEFHENQAHSGWSVGWHYKLDISKFSTLSFRVKSVSGNEKFEVGMETFKVEVVASSDWQEKRISLREFGDEITTNGTQNINFGFLRENGSGTICIDKIELLR
ncbi:MAG: hypothetical protein ACRC06_19305, partial [Waterburya sp.]